MATFFSLLPIYIFGNLHCMGMCGPLVLMLGRHRYRFFYFLGRTLSFTLAGLFAGGMGAVLHLFLHQWHLAAWVSFLFGGIILIYGSFMLVGVQVPIRLGPKGVMSHISQKISLLILKDRPFPVFLFGFLTIALPCGQTVIVYSTLALEGNLWIGLGNGLLFALMTSPSLFLAMRAQHFLGGMKQHYSTIMGCCAIVVGGMAVCRGLAEFGVISHFILNPGSSPEYHIALF